MQFWILELSLGPVNILSAEALHERWRFGHLSSYLFRS